MAYSFKLPQKKISIENKEIESIIELLDKILEQYKIKITVVNEEEHQKLGIWYSLIVTKVEKLTGEKHGSCVKILPEVKVSLDSFAYELLKDFQKFITNLQKIQKISSEMIIAEQISNKYVFISQILLRLLCHTLSSDKNLDEGKTLLLVTKDLLRNLNFKDIMCDSSYGFLVLSPFGAALSKEFGYWKNLMINSVSMNDLIHKNALACSHCFKLLEMLKTITLRQLTVFMDSTKSVCDYHDDYLLISFEICLVDLNISEIKIIINTTYPLILEGQQFNSELYASISKIVKNSNLKTKKNVTRIIALFCFLSEINAFYQLLARMSQIIAVLNWLPVITGTLEVTDFCLNLKKMSTKANEILNANTLNLTSDELIRLNKYSSNSAEDINLFNCFETATKQLEDLSNPENVAKLLEHLGFTVDGLISLQKQIGFTVIKEEKLGFFYQCLQANTKKIPNDITNEISTLDLKDKGEKITNQSDQIITPKTKHQLGFFNQTGESIQSNISATNPFAEQNLNVINLNQSSDNPTNNPNNANRIDSSKPKPFKICHIQINSVAITENHTYVLTYQNDYWKIKYYSNSQTKEPNIIDIKSVKGLTKIFQDISQNNITKISVIDIEYLIAIYHVNTHLKQLGDEKCYQEGLDFIKNNQEIIVQDSVLQEFSILCEAKFYYELGCQAAKRLENEPYNQTTRAIRTQTQELNIKAKKAQAEINMKINQLNLDNDTSDEESSEKCCIS